MWRALIAALALASCATPLARDYRGDFDGDGRSDVATFDEDDEGNLVLQVYRANAPQQPLYLWGGDIASYPYFSVSVAPAGRYETNCIAYDGCGANAPPHATLTHEGLIVRGSAPPSSMLFYWDGGSFRSLEILP